MSPKRAITVAVLASAAAAGAGIYTASRVWTSAERDRPGPLPDETITTTGGELAPWAVPAGVVALAGAIALIACSGLARRIVAVCVGLAGLGLVAAGVRGVVEAVGPWAIATGIVGLVVAVVAGWTVRAGGDWPGMSGRYDRSSVPQTTTALADDPAALWDALDNGQDPTAFSIGQTAPGEECAR